MPRRVLRSNPMDHQSEGRAPREQAATYLGAEPHRGWRSALTLLVLAGLSSAHPAWAEGEREPSPVAVPALPTPRAEPPEQPPAWAPVPNAPAAPPTAVAPPGAALVTSQPAARPERSGAAPVELSGEPGKGLTVTAGKAFSLNIRSRIQLRYQLDVPPEDASGNRQPQQLATVGTARLYLSGYALTPDLTYVVQLAVAGRDFRDAAISPVFDAFVDWKAHRDLNIRAGQFFVPFDRLRTIREFALQLADRPRPVGELTLDRDVGVTLYSDRFLGDRSPVAWRLSAFGGGGTNLTVGKEPGVLLVGRLELRPLGPVDDDAEGDLERRPKPGLAVGVGFANNWNTNRLRSTTGTTFSGGTTDYHHAAADLVFKWLGLALQTEYLWKRASIDQIASTSPDGLPVTEYTRSAHGWVLQSSYLFIPRIEIVGRLSQMRAFDGTDPRLVTELQTRGQEVAAGFNYYLTGHRFKIQADWIARMPIELGLNPTDHVVHVLLDATF